MLSPGIAQVAVSRSMSSQRASLASPERTAVSVMNSKQATVAQYAPDALTFSMAEPTYAYGRAL